MGEMVGTSGQRAAADDAGAGIDVKCVGLTKTFRDFWMRPRVRAVDGVDLEIRRGEVFGLLGPNGSGKSTTIKMILGLLSPTSGRIAVLGRRPRDVQSKKRIGYLPEESYLYRFLSARETLDYYGRLFRMPARVRRERIDMLLEMVGLEAVGHRPVGEFSKGMQRRVGLAQSLINDPQLLILDEPTSGMDPVGARQIKDLIADLGRRGKTVLLCTHQLSDVEDLCHRVAIMFGGRVRAEGVCDELLSEEDRTTISTAVLPADVITEIRGVLARRGITDIDVARPRRRLESLFLEIVEQARAEGARTSGATSGGRVADFLREATGPAGVASAAADAGERPASGTAPVDADLIDRLLNR
jgi:ABC-2 type transport system ATP-binding protein